MLERRRDFIYTGKLAKRKYPAQWALIEITFQMRSGVPDAGSILNQCAGRADPDVSGRGRLRLADPDGAFHCGWGHSVTSSN
jgi:hypothetical protein